ncbi:hypothetical protein P154DRAFT_417075, partial [Amniculicola lignicola CBS 123094]
KILEVERKFTPTTTSISLLRANTGSPPFKAHAPLGISYTHNVYFDHVAYRDLFMSRGIYIRQRNGFWEAKARLGGDFVNSKFTEYMGSEAVQGVVTEVLANAGLQNGRVRYVEEMEGLKGLSPIANFVTRRETWEVEDYKVVADETDFGCKVGEVELTDTVREGWDVTKVGEMMDKRIERFMERHYWAFPVTAKEVQGKLTAYFDR